MDTKTLIKTSKYLILHLRHQPAKLGLTLEPGGWVVVADLLAACATHHFPISRETLNQVVAGNDKQRFAFDKTGNKIRANQGHSVAVDLQLEPMPPPAHLYHGTGEKSVEAILKSGLLKMQRHHVHLSAEVETARRVGARHGRPAVLVIDASAMHLAGHPFYQSDNGVWLADSVPPQYLRLLS